MFNRLFHNISKRSYYKSLYLHIAFVLFVIIPLSFMIPQYLDSGKTVSSNNIKLITISEDDYKKITKNKSKADAILPTQQSVNDQKNDLDSFVKIAKKEQQKVKPKPKKKSSKKTEGKISSNTKSIPKKPPVPQQSQPQPATPIASDDKVDDILDSLEDSAAVDTEINLDQDTIEVSNIPEQTTIFGDVGDVISKDINISIKDIVAAQINRCWNEYYDPDASKKGLVVTAVIGYKQNGYLNKIDIENRLGIMDRNAEIYRIMVQNVTRAIHNCSPLKGLPVSGYDEWRVIKINFRHSDKGAGKK